jgi:RNA polymerase sigma-70 factor (ECF subfamily)
MEAARTLIDLPERIRRRRFTAACEELRPLGIAYVLRHFGQSLDRADAEDVVAEVIIRFDRLDAAGRPPGRLRPAFFQSVRNAALDLLRYRGIRPTAPLEAAATRTAEGPGPEERAEARENAVRLREAMARMRPNYREAIVLRFGLGLTVPEIAARAGISLPAAKKLVLRSTAQIRERMEAIEGREFCPEMREIAERSVIDGQVAGIDEDAATKAHLEHCGACRGFLAALRRDLHELGGSVLLAGLAPAKLGLGARLLAALHATGQGVHAGAARMRLASYRAGGALRTEGADTAGLLAGTGQKIAAVCTAGAAGAGACLATGIVGPGLGVAGHRPQHHHPAPTRPAQVREAPVPTHAPILTYAAPEVETQAGAGGGDPTPTPTAPRPRGRSVAKAPRPEAKPKRHHHVEAPPPTPSQTAGSQFGIEEEAPSAAAESTSTESSPPVAEARSLESTTSASSTGSAGSSSEGSKSTGAGGGHEEFGFGG